jgi:hypothetical protein
MQTSSILWGVSVAWAIPNVLIVFLCGYRALWGCARRTRDASAHCHPISEGYASSSQEQIWEVVRQPDVADIDSAFERRARGRATPTSPSPNRRGMRTARRPSCRNRRRDQGYAR